MFDLKTHLRKALRKRWDEATEEEKRKAASVASLSYWKSKTPRERSAEMKKRAKVRAKNRDAKRGKKAK
jgi:hypothetical protein